MSTSLTFILLACTGVIAAILVMMSSNGNLFRVTGHLCGEFTGIHRSPVNSPHKGQRRGALMFSLICVWINGWVNNREAGDLRRYRSHYNVIAMWSILWVKCRRYHITTKTTKSTLSVFQKTNAIVIPMFIFLTFIIQTPSYHSYFILENIYRKDTASLTYRQIMLLGAFVDICDAVNRSINLSCTVSVDKRPAINWRHCCVAAVTKYISVIDFQWFDAKRNDF